MVKRVLTEAGFVEGKTFRETRFLKPPKSTYAVYLDSFYSRGADGFNLIKDHSYTVELYSYAPDPEAEVKIEKALDDLGLAYEKEPRTWLNEEQLYQTIYFFNYIEK
jgi:hypothetical protein